MSLIEEGVIVWQYAVSSTKVLLAYFSDTVPVVWFLKILQILMWCEFIILIKEADFRGYLWFLAFVVMVPREWIKCS